MIKAIIFDFDNTIYVGDVLKDYFNYEKQILLKFLKDENVYNELVEKYKINQTFSLMETLTICKNAGYDNGPMLKYFSKHVYRHSPCQITILPNEVLKALSEKYRLYIISMSLSTYLKHYLSKYKIDAKCFAQILSASEFAELNKSGRMKAIMEKEGFNPSEVLAIGDNYDIDIVPAQRLGINTLHFNGNFNQMYDYFTENNILDCSAYKNKWRNWHS